MNARPSTGPDEKPGMKRRDFLSMFLAAATALSPRTGAAQQPERMRRVGVLLPFAENDVPALASVKDLAQALHRRGWTDDKNIRIDTRVAIIFNPDTAPYAPFLNAPVEAAAPSLGIMVTLAPAHDDEAIDKTAADVATEPGGGIIAMPDSFTTSHRNAIMAAAARHRLPLIGLPFFTSGGGLMSYWVDAAE